MATAVDIHPTQQFQLFSPSLMIPDYANFEPSTTWKAQVDSHGRLWFSNSNGIFYFDGNKIINFTQKIDNFKAPELYGNWIFFIKDDFVYLIFNERLIKINVNHKKSYRQAENGWEEAEFSTIQNNDKVNWCLGEKYFWKSTDINQTHTNIQQIDIQSGKSIFNHEVNTSTFDSGSVRVCNDRFFIWFRSFSNTNQKIWVFDKESKKLANKTIEKLNSHTNVINLVNSKIIDNRWLFNAYNNQLYRIDMQSEDLATETIALKNDNSTSIDKNNNFDSDSLLLLFLHNTTMILRNPSKGYFQLDTTSLESTFSFDMKGLPFFKGLAIKNADSYLDSFTLNNKTYFVIFNQDKIHIYPKNDNNFIYSMHRSTLDLHINEQSIIGICETKDDGLWSLTHTKNLSYQTSVDNSIVKEVEHLNVNKDLGLGQIASIKCDGNNSLTVINNQFGIYKLTYDPASNSIKYKKINDLSPYLQKGDTNSAILLHSDSQYYIVSTTKKIFYFSTLNNQLSRVVSSVKNITHGDIFKIDKSYNIIFTSYRSSNGIIYIYFYESNKWIQSTPNTSALMNDIKWIEIDEKNRVWLTNFSGDIFRFESNRLEDLQNGFNILLHSQISENSIFYCLLSVGENQFWFSTSNGIAFLDLTQQKPKFFRRMEAVYNADFNGSSCYKSTNTNGNYPVFYFGGLYGWTRIDSNFYQPPASSVPPFITSIQRGGSAWQFAMRDREFNASESDGAFRFILSSPYYSQSESLFFRVKLEGYDEKWNNPSQRDEYTYTRLSGGTYKILAQSSVDGNTWSDTSAYTLHIKPLWYRSHLAYVLYVSFIILAVAYWYFQRRKIESILRSQLVKVESSSNRLSLALWASGDGLWDLDINNMHVYRTPITWLDMPKVEASFDNDPYIKIIHPNDLRIYHDAIDACTKGDKTIFELEYRISYNHQWIWVYDRARIVINSQTQMPNRLTGVLRNINTLKHVEADLRKTASEDILTGLPNRQSHVLYLTESLEEANRTNTKVALFFIDLDRFKEINDTLGHFYGDEMLKAIANGMLTQLSSYQGLSIHRLGGDEFTIVLKNANEELIEEIASRLLVLSGTLYKLDGFELAISFSIGIAISPQHGKTVSDLMKHADTAMYAAKATGRNTKVIYEDRISASINSRLYLEVALRKDWVDQAFTLAFQPKIDLKSNQVSGVEVLFRWPNPEWSHVSIDEVIECLEACGLIYEVGNWIVENSLLYLSEVQELLGKNIKIAINVSVVQLKQGYLEELISLLTKQTSHNCANIEIEITESVLLSYNDQIKKSLDDLRNTGVKIVVDDFGKGYSSLSYLRDLPIDSIKIDRSFVDGIDLDGKTASICRSIVELAHNIDLTVVAEGVERQPQDELLKEMGCDYAQGNYHAHPMLTYEFLKWIAERKE